MLRGAVVAALLWLALTPPAFGTVSVALGSPDPDALYAPGETITLTVHVTANAGELDNQVFGRIQYPLGIVGPSTQTQYVLPPADGSWRPLTLSCGGTTAASCIAFNQVSIIGDLVAFVPVNVTDFLIATLTFNVMSANIDQIDFTWRTTPFTNRLDFFGVTNAPGYSVTVVPEPSTAALLGVGLLGLALGRPAYSASHTLRTIFPFGAGPPM